LIYNEFLSVIRQRVVEERILPIPEHVLKPGAFLYEYLYEPTEDEILRSLLPEYVRTQVWRVLLESVASEHGARMSAMDNATNNADEMIKDLTLLRNKIRQAAITREIVEVVSAVEALGG
jgi:F-type H+-transporting ATPase subunit gamma